LLSFVACIAANVGASNCYLWGFVSRIFGAPTCDQKMAFMIMTVIMNAMFGGKLPGNHVLDA
jgi:hypothetical protein